MKSLSRLILTLTALKICGERKDMKDVEVLEAFQILNLQKVTLIRNLQSDPDQGQTDQTSKQSKTTILDNKMAKPIKKEGWTIESEKEPREERLKKKEGEIHHTEAVIITEVIEMTVIDTREEDTEFNILLIETDFTHAKILTSIRRPNLTSRSSQMLIMTTFRSIKKNRNMNFTKIINQSLGSLKDMTQVRFTCGRPLRCLCLNITLLNLNL
jgi:hypothetical protein